MDLYREQILEHWRNPQNYGEIANADIVIEQVNPLCGDRVSFFFKIKDGKIRNVSFVGSGCAISIAAASILSERIKNQPISAVAKITGKDVLKLIGGKIAPARLKCAFLALEAVRKITDKSEARNPKS